MRKQGSACLRFILEDALDPQRWLTHYMQHPGRSNVPAAAAEKYQALWDEQRTLHADRSRYSAAAEERAQIGNQNRMVRRRRRKEKARKQK